MNQPTYDEKWLAAYCARNHMKNPLEGEASGPQAPEKRRSKYGNRKAELDGETYASVHEAQVSAELKLRARAGEFLGLAKQVDFYLPGGVIYRADFVLLRQDGSYTVIDAKSEATRKDKVYRLKKRQMKECLGLEILEV